MKKLSRGTVQALLVIFISVCSMIALLFQVDSRWVKPDVAEAQQAQIEQLALRLDQKIMQDKADFLQRRMWKLEDRYGHDMPPTVLNEYRHLLKELNDSKMELEFMRKK